jgi:hypothetical protein
MLANLIALFDTMVAFGKAHMDEATSVVENLQRRASSGASAGWTAVLRPAPSRHGQTATRNSGKMRGPD